MWEYHDKKMIELKKIYNKTSKQTQNKLQEIFDSFQIGFSNLYNIVDNKTKIRVNSYIEEWQDNGMLIGYFGMLAKNIRNRIRVKNSEILELFIYSAYIEEQAKLKAIELDIFKNLANYYYIKGQEEVNKTLPKKKRKSIIPISDILFFTLLAVPNSKGCIWQEYINAITKNNADQIYRQATICLQQQKPLKIDSDMFQLLIKKQQNQRLNINGDKISGDIDLTLIGMNNQAKIEGIKRIDNDAKAVFLANMDGKETDMCHSLHKQIFYINRINEFDRYYGETQDQLRIQRIRCKGLVLGLNLPPISHHFHWCRSMVQYVSPTVEKEEKTEYNLDIPKKISNKVKPFLTNINLNRKINKLFKRYLIDDNLIYDRSRNVPAWYSEEDDLIHINPNKVFWNDYIPEEVFVHEISHLIDKRYNILQNNKNISSLIRSSKIDISLNIEEYKNKFNDENLYYDMSAGDTISLLSDNQVPTFYYHPLGYNYIEEDILANMETAYLTDNEIALNLFKENDATRKLLERIIKAYGKYT